MKRTLLVCIALAALMLSGCATSDPTVLTTDEEVSGYEKVVAELEAKGGSIAEGSIEEDQAMARLQDFFRDMTPESVKEKCQAVYAGELWFNDTVKTFRFVEEVEEYFIETAENVDTLTVAFTDIAVSDGNYYVRWVMSFKIEGDDEMLTSIGMTHFRFNNEGKVVLHQDYWDSASGLYEHLPVVGGLIRYVKKRL